MRLKKLVMLFLFLLILCGTAFAQTTSFTYQGRLTDSGNSANGNYDLQFALWDNSSGGAQIGSTQAVNSVAVNAGIFTVTLDFGVSAFPGANRFLEISVRPAGSGSFTTLAPRQQISSTPYAIRTLSATTADGLSSACVACVQDSQINQVAGSKVSGTIPVASVPDLSASYIKNTNTQQANSNFNISGNGIVGGSIGIGATSPATKLDVRGHLLLDPGANPIVYASSTGGEQNRFLQLINSPSTPSASGLKAGGLLVADSFGFADPAKNDLIVKGNIGLGLSAPLSKFHLFGSANIVSPFRGLTIDQTVNAGAMTNGYAMAVMTTTGGVTSTNFLIDSLGKTGVGTPSPSARFHVAQSGDFQLRLENTASGGGFWNIGQADNSFLSGGGKLIFVPNTINSTNAAVVFTNAGKVGIGTTAPTQLLHVNSGSGNAAALVQTPTNGFAQYQLQSGATNPWIVGTQDNFAGNALLFRNGSTDLIKVQPNGNVLQPRDKGGFVKAMVYVLENGTIDRCYNGLTGASLTGGTTNTGCGFTVTKIDNGAGIPFTYVDLGFKVDDRFWSVTPSISGSSNIGANASVGGNIISVSAFYADERLDTTNAPFMLIVF